MSNSNTQTGIGSKALPENICNSIIFTENNIQQLASVQEIPFVDPAYYDDRLKTIFQYYSINPNELENELQFYAKELLDKGKIKEAWQVLLSVS